MNQEIKLPPLPETEYLLGIPARPYESEWISRDPAWGDSAMQDYATAAVELDRAQRGGEPVAWIWRFPDGGLHETLFGTLVECERDAIGYAGSAIPLYTALAAQQTAPAWHDAPDKPGIWLCDEGDICYTWTAHSIEILDIKPEDDARWFGPIPPDGDTK